MQKGRQQILKCEHYECSFKAFVNMFKMFEIRKILFIRVSTIQDSPTEYLPIDIEFLNVNRA